MKCYRLKEKAVFVSIVVMLGFVFFADAALAQNISIPGPASPADLFTPENIMIAMIAARLIMVVGVVIAGMVALVSGFNWLYSEGNAAKAYANKYRLAKALGVITALFFLMIMYRVFVPDYSILSL